MNLGIFGGTFDPPHVGHLIVAEHAREELGLNKVLFVPSAITPHKQHDRLSDPGDRLEMVELALQGQAFLQLCDVEVRRGGVSYTVDTLLQLKTLYPDGTLTLLMGLDNLAEFNSWKSPERILQLATVVVMTRPGFPCEGVTDEVRQMFTFCRVPDIGISSTGIRERVRAGKSIRYLVPEQVESYIYNRRLYTSN